MIDKSILISIDYSIFEKMEKFVKNLQLLVLILILISTIVAIGLEVKTMIENGSVSLADLLLMFLYLEVLAMIRVFWAEQSINITLPLFIAITALARFIILQGKEMDPTALVYEAVAIVLIAGAIVILRSVSYTHLTLPTICSV